MNVIQRIKVFIRMIFRQLDAGADSGPLEPDDPGGAVTAGARAPLDPPPIARTIPDERQERVPPPGDGELTVRRVGLHDEVGRENVVSPLTLCISNPTPPAHTPLQ